MSWNPLNGLGTSTRRKVFGAAVAAPALALAGMAGAGAQEVDDDAETEHEGHGHHHHRRGGKGLKKFADALGLEPAELRSAVVEDGVSIADVAADQGVDIDAVIADLVAEAEQHAAEQGRDLDSEALTERLTEIANSDEIPRRGRHLGRRAASEVIQDFLEMSADDIKAAVQEGSTIADLVEEQGKEVEDLADAIVDDIESRLSDHERFDPERFAEREDELTDRITDRLNGERPERDGRPGPGRRGHGPRGPIGAGDAG